MLKQSPCKTTINSSSFPVNYNFTTFIYATYGTLGKNITAKSRTDVESNSTTITSYTSYEVLPSKYTLSQMSKRLEQIIQNSKRNSSIMYTSMLSDGSYRILNDMFSSFNLRYTQLRIDACLQVGEIWFLLLVLASWSQGTYCKSPICS